MTTHLKLATAGICLAALLGCSTGTLQVAEVGSYHVGGRSVTLSGLPAETTTVLLESRGKVAAAGAPVEPAPA